MTNSEVIPQIGSECECYMLTIKEYVFLVLHTDQPISDQSQQAWLKPYSMRLKSVIQPFFICLFFIVKAAIVTITYN